MNQPDVCATLSDADYAEIGRALVAAVVTCDSFGWSTLDGVTEYVAESDDPRRQFVLDVCRAQRIGQSGAEARVRVAAWVNEHDSLRDEIAAAMI